MKCCHIVAASAIVASCGGEASLPTSAPSIDRWPRWSQPARIDAESRFDHSALLAVSAAGEAVAVWSHDVLGGRGRTFREGLRASRFVPGSGWGAARAVPGTRDEAADAVALDDTRWAVVVGRSQRGVWASHAGGESEWSSPEPLTADLHVGPPLVVLPAAGMSLAAWVGFDDGRASVWASVQDANGHWMRPEPVALDGDRVNSLDLVADGRGRALAMWYEATRPGGGSIFANRFLTTAGWEGAVLVAESGMFPVAGFDASGGALAAWATLEGVMSARLLPDSGWTAEARGLGAGSGTYQLRLAVAPTGHALAVWREQDASAAYETRAALYAPDTGWSPRHRLGVGGDGAPQVLLDGTTGRGLVLAGTDGHVCSQAYLPSEGWGAGECLGPGSDARAAMDAAGVVTAVWTYDDAIWSARLLLRGDSRSYTAALQE